MQSLLPRWRLMTARTRMTSKREEAERALLFEPCVGFCRLQSCDRLLGLSMTALRLVGLQPSFLLRSFVNIVC